ncbi:beta-hexosaminidase [Labilibacter sediminis]|nr:beta-hexosaminidase [Labilibacter sediminis]
MKKQSFYILLMTYWFLGMTGFATTSVEDFLLPIPQKIKVDEGVFVSRSGRIDIDASIDDNRLLSEISEVRNLFSNIGFRWTITKQCAVGEKPVVYVAINPDLEVDAQGYILEITNDQIELIGVDVSGVFNGLQTMRQLIRYAKHVGHLPLVSVTDYPDFKNRGFMLDVSRDKVPQLKTLFGIINHLAEWKINQLQLYTEHTFAYRNHKKVWQDFSAYTAEDIIKINQYCQERFIELVPNQNSLGHMERWLAHAEYQELAELEEVQKDGPRHLQRRTTLNPVDPRSMDLVKGLYDELLPNFSSKTVNIGGDEPWELGHGRSKKACDENGKGEVYISYMSELTNFISDKGYSPQMWADIILKYPDQIHRLPKDLTCMVWGYRFWYPFEKNCKKMHEAGVPFYVCPGTSSWSSFIGRWPNAKENLLKAAQAGKKYNAKGYLNTDWGDFGHWQPFAISYPAIIYGAGLCWSVDQNEQLDVAAHLSHSLFDSSNPILAKLILELGEAYKVYDEDISFYVNVFYDILKQPNASLSTKKLGHVNADNTDEMIDHLNKLISQLTQCSAFSDEQQLVIEELVMAARFSRHTAMMARERLQLPDHRMELADKKVKEVMLDDLNEILADFHRLWLIRNRPGGLENSKRGFQIVKDSYKIK